MAIDFPASPTNGQTFTSGSVTYTYDGTKWTAVAAGGSSNSISQGNTNATVTDTGSDGRFVVTTEGSERLRVDSSGRLGVGTAAPGEPLSVATSSPGSSATVARLQNTGTTSGTEARLLLSTSTSTGSTVSSGIACIATDTTGNTALALGSGTAGSYSEKARLDSSGRLLVGTSSSTDAKVVIANGSEQQVSFKIDNTNSSPVGVQIRYGTDVNGAGNRFIDCIGNATTRFLVFSNGNVQNTNNSYAGISDLKLKENIIVAASQWDDIKALEVKKFNFIGDDKTQIGLIAQDVEQICPGLIEQSADTDNEGNETGEFTKAVKYSVLYMKAVKALQEAMERIEILEAKVAALEGP